MVSLWQMSQFSLTMDARPVIVSGIVVFVPLSTTAFAMLDPTYRADAAALFRLVRNIGSSVGISAVTVMLAHNIIITRGDIISALTPFNPNVDQLSALGLDPAMTTALLNATVQTQASFIAYVDDFRLMMFVTLAVIPLVLFLRKPKGAPPEAAAAAME